MSVAPTPGIVESAATATTTDTRLLVEPIAHCRQKYNWDCGVACLYMICRAFGVECTHESLISDLGQESIWTIDIAHCLARHSIRCTMLTTLDGINPSYEELSFYTHELEEDARRVQRLFAEAAQNNIVVAKQSLTSDELYNVVGSGKIVLILVDRRNMRCSLCDSMFGAFFRRSLPSFLGHFVVLYQLNPASLSKKKELHEYLFYDPACSQPQCSVSWADLEIARKALGTDEDMLIIDPSLQQPALGLDRPLPTTTTTATTTTSSTTTSTTTTTTITSTTNDDPRSSSSSSSSSSLPRTNTRTVNYLPSSTALYPTPFLPEPALSQSRALGGRISAPVYSQWDGGGGSDKQRREREQEIVADPSLRMADRFVL